LDLLTYSIYIFVSLTRLFLNLYTAHSDVGGTISVYIVCQLCVEYRIYSCPFSHLTLYKKAKDRFCPCFSETLKNITIIDKNLISAEK
jgi:hypothetical protein